MAEFRWIQMFSSVILMLQLSAAADHSEFIIRDGSEATLSCENVTDDQHKCNSTTWLFSKPNRAVVTLFEHGKIHREAKNKSDRLSVTANCSLVVKKVTAEDVGQYTCRQFRGNPGTQQGPDSVAELSVVNITEYKDDNTVTLKCSVSTYKECKYTVKWLYDGNKDLRMSQSTCSASVTFATSDHIYTSKSSEMLKCQVTHGGNVQEFIFSQSSGVWKFIVVALGLTVLIMSAFIGILWKRVKGHKSQMNENAELNLNPAVTLSAPGTIQDSAESEYAVPYSSISYTNNTTSKAQLVGQDDDEDDDTVTYITMKSHIASAAPSSDPSSLYAAVNKPVGDTC
ncbi:uncharacterized protein LOC120433290 isoform X2 [Oreochromis aureus]|uniref:uncharacterized protein LOC120433290 isoform X2 n=1 Tax=Oreochromis aureus TaxID=47969 RepID=UPI001953CEBF|nr:uncharacterized protein LOC120433290 isoform X2 [Oreochromis aureus]